LNFRDGGMQLTYVLDLAEIPTFEILGSWHVDSMDQAAMTAKAREQAGKWLENLALTRDGKAVPLVLDSISPTATPGAGGMPVLRIEMTANAKLQPGEVAYEDRNFPGRAGWKEVVVGHDASALLQRSSRGGQDLSAGLTVYPTDPGIAPPQDLTAQVQWTPALSAVAKPVRQMDPGRTPKSEDRAAIGLATLAAGSQSAPPQQSAFSQQQPTAAGTVVRGDFLSRLLQRRELPFGVMLAGILAAFALGSLHALSPGHGKTIVAAYLVGSRGTLKHAGLLGFVVTFTHTFTVFLLGLGVLFFQQYIVPEKIVPVLGAISGLSIAAVGLTLLYQRSKALLETAPVHHHTHDHPHPHDHHHDHGHDHHTHSHETTHAHAHAAAEKVMAASSCGAGASAGQDRPQAGFMYAGADASCGTGVSAGHDRPQAGLISTRSDSEQWRGAPIQTHSYVAVAEPAKTAAHNHDHPHDHDHVHSHEKLHTHPHPHAEVAEPAKIAAHDHPHVHTHSHGGHTHSHDVPDRITPGSLIALGVSGGMVPCPSALILMLSAIALGRPALGLFLLIGFSTGLAVVLMGIGMLALYARHLLPDSEKTRSRPLFRLIPVFSAVVVILLGIAMTAVAAGWVQAPRFLI
jgi:ABC-type nickel/cobalt efflux system permease component RcnA